MKFGFSLKRVGLDPSQYPAVGRAAEEHGFESVWLPEHLVLPVALPATYPYSESGQAPISPATDEFDPWVALAAVAAVTSTLRLATGVFILPLRHPFPTARALMTLDRISQGRVTLGIGVGWMAEEFAAADQDFSNRGARTDEIVAILRRLWTEDVVEHRGAHYAFEAVRFEPKPVQQPIPIEVGGTSPAALRRAGRLGDGWIELGSRSIEELRDRLEVVQEARRAAGREHLPFEVTVSGGPDADTVKRYRDLGVTRVLAARPVGDRPTAQALADEAARYADEVIARV